MHLLNMYNSASPKTLYVGVMIDAGRTLYRALCKFRATPRTILGKNTDLVNLMCRRA